MLSRLSFCLWIWISAGLVLFVSPDLAAAARWEIHRGAGLQAAENGDYERAVEQLEAAIYYASEFEAPDREIGLLWEQLTSAYLADGQYQQAWNTTSLWERLLVANVNQPWAIEQQARRDQLTGSLFQQMRDPSDEPSVPPATTVEPQAEPTETEPAALQAPPENVAAVPQVVVDQPVSVAEPPATSGAYAVHLATFSSEERALNGWDQMRRNHPALLEGKSLVLRKVDHGDQGILTRVLAAPFADATTARDHCAKLRQLAQYCAVMKME